MPAKAPASPLYRTLFQNNKKQATPQGAQALPQEGVYLELGGVRIYLDRPDETQAVLLLLLKVTNQKNLAHLLGITPRTYRRWRQAGKLPRLEGKPLAQILEQLRTIPASIG